MSYNGGLSTILRIRSESLEESLKPLDSRIYHSIIPTANSDYLAYLSPFPHKSMATAVATKSNLTVTISPLGDRVVVRPLEMEQVTASGIVIPDTASGEKPQEGEVLAVGPGEMKEDGNRKPMDVKVGDKVLFGKYAGDDIKLKDASGKDVEVKVLHQDSILGIVS